MTEDTGGSTRLPAFFNHNVGYDPSRNHYPNAGNPGMTFTNDQIGLNARSLDDILLLDAALLGLEAEHAAALAAAPSAGEIRVGLPQWPFVEFTVPDGAPSSRPLRPCSITSAALGLGCAQSLELRLLRISGC